MPCCYLECKACPWVGPVAVDLGSALYPLALPGSKSLKCHQHWGHPEKCQQMLIWVPWWRVEPAFFCRASLHHLPVSNYRRKRSQRTLRVCLIQPNHLRDGRTEIPELTEQGSIYFFHRKHQELVVDLHPSTLFPIPHHGLSGAPWVRILVPRSHRSRRKD